MGMSRTGRLFSGLVVGAALGGGIAILLSSRANVAIPGAHASGKPVAGPTPFEPINGLVVRARSFVSEVKSQIQQAVEEGRATAELTKKELTAQFEAAKKASSNGHKL